MRASTGSPRACSGLMYAGVPTTAAARVIARPRSASIDRAGEAEVEDLDAQPRPFEPDVRRLDVAVDEALLVGGGQTLGDLPTDADDLGVHRRPRVRLEARGERHALQQRHHEERQPGVLADLEDGGDVVVLDLRLGAGLAEEPARATACGRRPGEHDLERHLAPQRRVLGPVHRPHPALTDEGEDAVRADLLGGGSGSSGTNGGGAAVGPPPVGVAWSGGSGLAPRVTVWRRPWSGPGSPSGPPGRRRWADCTRRLPPAGIVLGGAVDSTRTTIRESPHAQDSCLGVQRGPPRPVRLPPGRPAEERGRHGQGARAADGRRHRQGHPRHRPRVPRRGGQAAAHCPACTTGSAG